MIDDSYRDDADSLLKLLYSNKTLLALINDIQVDDYINNSITYKDFLRRHYLDFGQYKKSMKRYAIFLKEVIENTVPELDLVDVGSSRIAVGYKQVVAKIWYNTKVQHLDDLQFDEKISEDDFPYKFPIYYSDEHLIITKKYETFIDTLQPSDELLQAELDIKDCCSNLSLNDDDVNLYNIGYDPETSSYVLLDYGFMIGYHECYISNNEREYYLAFKGEPTTAYIRAINEYSILFGNCPIDDYTVYLEQKIDPALTQAILDQIFYYNYDKFADRTDIIELPSLITDKLQEIIYFARVDWDALPDFSAIEVCKYAADKVEVLADYYLYSKDMDEEFVNKINTIYYLLGNNINDEVALEAANVSISMLQDIYPRNFVEDSIIDIELESW